MVNRQLVIAQKDSSQKFYFNSKCNIVISNSLSDDLLKQNYFNGENIYYVEKEDGTAIESIFQFRVNVAKVGIFIVYFNKETFTDEIREQLIKDVSTLKSNGEVEFETQKNKIPNLFKMFIEAKPIFVCFSNTGESILTRSMFEDMLKDIDTSFPLLILMQSFISIDEEQSQKKKSRLSLHKKEPKIEKDKPINENKKNKEHRSVKEVFSSMYSLDFVFFGIFSMFVAFSGVSSLHRLMAKEGIGVFLIVMMALFIITLYYATYRSYKEEEKFSYELNKIWIPALYIAIGVTLGIITGYLVVTNAFKDDPEVVIDTALVLSIMSPVTAVISILSLFSPIPLSKIISKLRKK